jgi:hypothetical protein
MLFMALLQRFSFILLFITLVGCGGSSGGFDDTSEGTDEGTSPDTITISLAISDRNLSQATPRRLTVIVMQGNLPLADKLVTFSVSNEDLASFNTDVNTSSTDINGKAEIGLIAGVSSGDGSITASAEGMSSNSVTFTSAGDGDVVGQPVASAVSLFASSQQIASSGDDDVTLITIAKDEDNNLVEGVNVSFSATSGQIEVVNSVTGSDGKASAILRTNNEPTNRLITVTSTSGQVADSVDVQVIGTSINLTGSSSLAINDENSFFIQVLNSESVGVANVTVDLSLSDEADEDSAAITIVESVTTDSSGQINFSVTGTTGGTNTIIATALGATVSHTVSVQADSFLFSSFGNGEQTVDPEVDSVPDVFLSSSSARNSAEIEVTWTQSNTPVADGTIVNFTTTRGVITREENITQDGKVSAVIASDNAGKALVTVTGQNGEVILSNQLEFEFVAENVDNISAQASSNSIAPNGDISTISVIAKDINGNLVKGKIIEFTLTDTSGGNILPATALTDSNGSASTLYTSNSVSAQNGVSIIATVQDAPSKTDTVTLTVADRQLFISLGTGNELEEPTITTYNKQYSVFVTDVDSTPQAGVVLKVSAVPNNYYKGEWVKVLDESGDFSSWGASYSTIPPCPNEDLNVDGILDVGEDTNNDGKLTPKNVVSASGDVTTDEFGQAVIDIRYTQSFATWVDINLIVSAKVSGTENSTQTRFSLPVLATDVLNEDVTPPTSGIGLASPFGVVGDCSVSD